MLCSPLPRLCERKMTLRPNQRRWKACEPNRGKARRKDRAAVSVTTNLTKVPRVSQVEDRDFVPVQKAADPRDVARMVAGRMGAQASRQCGAPVRADRRAGRKVAGPALGAAAFRAVRLVPE